MTGDSWVEGAPWPSAGSEVEYSWDAPTAAGALDLRDVSLASTDLRALGFFVDAAYMSIGPVLVYVAFAASLTQFNQQHGAFSTTSLVLLGLFVASLTVFVAYPAWFIGRRGRTPGMKVAGVRLYRIDRADGAERLSTPDRSTAWCRAVVAMGFWLILFFGPAVDYIWSFDSKGHQCLHDKFGRTVVVDERDKRR